LLVISSVVQAVKPGEAKETYAQENAILRSITSNIEAVRGLRMGSPPEESEAQIKQIRAALDDPISNLVTDAETKPAAARMYVVMRTEQGQSIPDKMLQVLRNSKEPLDQTYYEIYRAEKIDPARAQLLALKLPKEPFVNQLAAVHTLEKGGSQTARSERINRWYVVRLGVVMLTMLGLFFSGLVAWGVYLTGRKNEKYTPRGHPIGRVTLADADRLAIRGAQIIGAYLIILILLPRIDKYVVPLGKGATIAAGIAIIAFIVLISRVPIMGKQITLESIGIRREGLGKNILWGIAGFLAEIPVVAMLGLIGLSLFRFLPPPSHPANEAISQAGNIVEVLPILFMASILAPIWEEILFRGILFPALGRVTGSVLSGALYSSLLFGFIHPQGPALAFALAGVGAVSCGLAYQTRSLVPSIVLHILHNSALMIGALLMM
jgi:membrane protease YdiL (CAAX protease family)